MNLSWTAVIPGQTPRAVHNSKHSKTTLAHALIVIAEQLPDGFSDLEMSMLRKSIYISVLHETIYEQATRFCGKRLYVSRAPNFEPQDSIKSFTISQASRYK